MQLSLKVKEKCHKVDLVTLGPKVCGVYTFPMVSLDIIEEGPVKRRKSMEIEKSQTFHPLGIAQDEEKAGEIITPAGLEIDIQIVEKDATEYLFLIDADILLLQKGFLWRIFPKGVERFSALAERFPLENRHLPKMERFAKWVERFSKWVERFAKNAWHLKKKSRGKRRPQRFG